MPSEEPRVVIDRPMDDILRITLNRPKTLNAVDPKMRLELIDAFAEASRDKQSRVVIITGAGRGFCSGGDVTNFVKDVKDRSGNIRDDSDVQDDGKRILDALLWIQKPVIAAVNGPAVGFGATLALL